MSLLKAIALFILSVGIATSQAVGQAPATPAPQSAESKPAPQGGPRFDVNNLDKSADPCTDFYQYACGGWLAHNQIPPDKSSWGRFNELDESNRAILHKIMEQAAAPNPKRDALEQKYGDYYASCMDEKTIDAKGIAPLRGELERITRMKNKEALPAELAHLHSLGVNAAFAFRSDQDFKDSSQEIAEADQGGLGLPERDYYFKTDPKSEEQRQQYAKHVANMFRLLGETPQAAEADAKTVMEMETAMAKGSLNNTQRREPANIYHKMTEKELAGLSPAFDWKKYLVSVQVPQVESLNVAVPDFVRALQQLIADQPLENWKTYLRWRLVHSQAIVLPTPFVKENFDYYGKTLRGQEQDEPRWKRCVRYTNTALGEAVGQKYVDLTFGVEGKARTMKMIRALEAALADDIQQLPWMTEETKKQALVKLAGIANKIGYPDKWRDYSSLKVVRGDAVGNNERGNAFEFRRQLNKIGKPVDRNEWQMSPPTVNAYYDAQMNDINFPAGILQPPFYDNNMDDAVNFGGIGAVIGHELTHGFDDEGRQFDVKGNLKDWWTPQDGKEFEKRASCIADEYSQFVAVKDPKDPKNDVHVNGKLTLGENTADNGGLRIAYMALMDTLAGKPQPPIDGLTAAQRLFLGWGQVWCEKMRPEFSRVLALTNEHAASPFRVNGVVSNMPEFQKAYSCKADAPMVRHPACRVW